MRDFCVIIPAIKKNVAFADDLVKKLDGISLIQRAINKAKSITPAENIFVVTDSEEISVISERNEINYYYEKTLKLEWQKLFSTLKLPILQISKKYRAIIILSAYVPLVSADEIQQAYLTYQESGCQALVTIQNETRNIFANNGFDLLNFLTISGSQSYFVESKAFLIINSKSLCDIYGSYINVCPYVLSSQCFEIRNYTDWWICEKILRRKRIVFRVIGFTEVGMGHIFRTLALAHEISDHEIRFVCDEQSSMAVNVIAGYDYLVEVYPKQAIEDRMIELRPHMIINDILDTDAGYIRKLKSHGIKVVNFEDLGSGAPLADMTINELYDNPVLEGKSIRWGYKYFFLRDEFASATPHKFSKSVTGLLITFGGTDQNNYTLLTLQSVIDFCKISNIRIFVVVGSGYPYLTKLKQYIDSVVYKNIEFTSATGVISKIMEKTQFAITSNGRTTYELAHMNIPAIVIAQHDRESTHDFACKENGFINIRLRKGEVIGHEVQDYLLKMVKDEDYRRLLYNNISRFNFTRNKHRVVTSILGVFGRKSSAQ